MLTESVLCGLSDNDVIKLAQEGDESAMEHIIIRYNKFAHALAEKYYMNGYDSEDIVQEAMIALLDAAENFNPKVSSFRTFAALCITRRIISVLKSTKRKKNIPQKFTVSLDGMICEDGSMLADTIEDPKKCNPESIVISKENLTAYNNKIQKNLSRFEYEVLNYHLNDKSYKEIALLTDKNIKAVDNAIQRIKKKLYFILNDDN
ncbi:MAG: sigma-70 family RNA polymerase sigma factor [Clostridia bacterium]|nr:sigma-70 family RNA polymerase sigma factor [Clostridia bacterium]